MYSVVAPACKAAAGTGNAEAQWCWRAKLVEEAAIQQGINAAGTAGSHYEVASSTGPCHGVTQKPIVQTAPCQQHHAPTTAFLDALMGARGAEGEHEASRRMKTEMLIQLDRASRELHFNLNNAVMSTVSCNSQQASNTASTAGRSTQTLPDDSWTHRSPISHTQICLVTSLLPCTCTPACQCGTAAALPTVMAVGL